MPFILFSRRSDLTIINQNNINEHLSLAKFTRNGWWQTSVSSKFNVNWVVTDVCQQQILRELAVDRRLSPVSSFLIRNSCPKCKHCRPLSDAVFWGVWSGSTLFANVLLWNARHIWINVFLLLYKHMSILSRCASVRRAKWGCNIRFYEEKISLILVTKHFTNMKRYATVYYLVCKQQSYRLHIHSRFAVHLETLISTWTVYMGESKTVA